MGTRICRLLAAVGLAAVTLVGAGATPALAGSATRELPAQPRYVSLGDSYTAGPLIPVQRLEHAGCLRSTNNYPSLLAKQLDASSFTDASCSGADTTDMTNSQDLLLGKNPPQFDALTADTDLVTVGIGGNDFGVFGDIISTCPKLRDSDPTGAPCEAYFNSSGTDELKAEIDQTQQRVTDVVSQIHQISPNARVLVIGYPRIAPPSGYCPDILPFADGDYAYLDGIEQYLDGALQQAAVAGGGEYVDTYTPSLGHDACATGGAAWINGKQIKLTAAPYHPNATGMAGIESIIATYLQPAQDAG